MEEVEKYIRDMHFQKKAIGGVDEESVLMHIRMIQTLYEGQMSRMIDAKQKEELDREIEDLRRELDECRSEKERLAQELEETKAFTGIHEMRNADLEASKREYEEKRSAYSLMIAEIEEQKKEIMSKAREDAAREAAELQSRVSRQVQERREKAQQNLDDMKRRGIEYSKEFESKLDECIVSMMNAKTMLASLGMELEGSAGDEKDGAV